MMRFLCEIADSFHKKTFKQFKCHNQLLAMYIQGVRKNLILRFSAIKSEINMACQKVKHHCIPN